MTEAARVPAGSEAQHAEPALVVIFDGGSVGNPGPGYGSYAFLWPGQVPEVHRLCLGPQMTNNEAEYETLNAALEALLQRLESMGQDPARVRLEVRGDSQLVINQLSGRWRVRNDRLRQRWLKAQVLLQRFGQIVLQHQPRSWSVAVLGH
ncbi:MAG: ribonuclease HI family protein [Anaerolineae bacterium]|nr:ribonuclease HI family protein [Anaerolineae bacterium]MDW8100417.1 ribonuclease HI family protein [Anaerolineae bacterium]